MLINSIIIFVCARNLANALSYQLLLFDIAFLSYAILPFKSSKFSKLYFLLVSIQTVFSSLFFTICIFSVFL
jgi:hypothetical protein